MLSFSCFMAQADPFSGFVGGVRSLVRFQLFTEKVQLPGDFFQVLLQPAAVFPHKRGDLLQCDMVRGSDDHLAVMPDLQRKCAPGTADDPDGGEIRLVRGAGGSAAAGGAADVSIAEGRAAAGGAADVSIAGGSAVGGIIHNLFSVICADRAGKKCGRMF